ALMDNVEKSMAVDMLARKALGEQWDKLDAAQRKHFVELIAGNLEKSGFPRASAALANLKVSFEGEERVGADRRVRTIIINPDGSKLPVDYLLARRDRHWQIVDVMLDGESLSNAAAGRIEAALKQGGYPKLVADLQRQIDGQKPID